MHIKRFAILTTGISILVTMVITVIFQDNIVRFFLKPKTPFQISTPPRAPDYKDRASWILRPTKPVIAENAPDDTTTKPSTTTIPPTLRDQSVTGAKSTSGSTLSDHDDKVEGISAELRQQKTNLKSSAEIFYVHSTTYYSAENWNAPINDETAKTETDVIAAPNEIGPFLSVGRVFAPRYRQATISAQFSHKYDAMAARATAYVDVANAFREFLIQSDSKKPLFLVGYGQGALLAMGLLKEFFEGDDNGLRRRLAAAYLIGASVPKSYLNEMSPPIPVCADPRAVRCVISYTDYEAHFKREINRIRARSIVWSNDLIQESVGREPLVCVNPLDWHLDSGPLKADRHHGAASATGLSFNESQTMPNAPIMSREIGAACVDGVLITDRPKQSFMRRKSWFGGKWRARPYNLFYQDLADNAALRRAALTIIMEDEARYLKPIETKIDIGAAPINKVPE
ncbi:MAG: DUF3089 domain-containing protein [Pseudomonadota bacterium]